MYTEITMTFRTLRKILSKVTLHVKTQKNTKYLVTYWHLQHNQQAFNLC